MTGGPRVSIIIPTYNRPHLLDRSVDSALAQTGAVIEVIVVDDGSDPPAQVRPLPNVTLIRTGNQGAAAARNVGLERGSGAYVLFLDSDDWLEPDAIASLVGAMQANDAAIVCGTWRNVVEPSGATNLAVPSSTYTDSLAKAVAENWVTGSFLMARHLAARFDPGLKVWEVTTFLCQSLAGDAKAADCGRVVVNIAQHSDDGRVSILHDHFEPLRTARAFAAIKASLAARDLLNGERIAALDAKLIGCLHGLLRDGRPEAKEVYAAVDWTRPPLHARERPGSFSWCTRRGGLTGARGFMTVHRALDTLAGLLGASTP